MTQTAIHYLIVPGWQNSPADHWQSHWQQCLPNARRVEQDDWFMPQPQAWVQRLDEAVRAAPGTLVLIAHSLGCVTLARWAAQADAQTLARIGGALLVAPADVERSNCPPPLRGFAPIASEALPFPSLLVGSDNDPAASAQRALQLARDWGSEAVLLTGAGHINRQSGFDRWEQGFAYLYRLQRRIEQAGRLRA
ncbi:RBBP9/YdeN family alpha/beta hydrolase [Pseudomonas mangrovi]|jgi:predicted alpha/beta hydrolase family esterase|uniref:Alpha/beta hydrolase n=1 Tax=Pseudomonas mangrovi TaxID=2161748 RepID=A0A2T5P9G5_9PSED|nr:alpha/beta hydrolase [Pseudomonas mangrovi]PTU74367.1 alpha/beta hydrolase [Pseudomonas mangrovi]